MVRLICYVLRHFENTGTLMVRYRYGTGTEKEILLVRSWYGNDTVRVGPEKHMWRSSPTPERLA